MRVHARVQSIATGLMVLAAGACADRPVAERSLGPNLAAPRAALSALPAGGSYWDLDVNPAAPLAFNEPGWDVQEYTRDQASWYTPETVNAHHGMDCSAPPALHQVSAFQDMVFRCKNHIMTAINSSSYGAIVLTPDRMLDFSKGPGVIRFDISSFQSSDRDWISIWLSPYDEQLAVPATSDAPGLNGPPKNGLFVKKSMNNNLCPFVVSNFVETALPCDDWRKLSDLMPLSMSVRNTVEIEVSRTHVKVWMPNENIIFADADLPSPLSFDVGVVQFGHYSYNPTKCEWACATAPAKTPNTWHWDEIYVAPSVPFSIARGDRRYVDGAGGVVNFASAAPAGAKLRFFAAGIAPDVSFDNGATWAPALEQNMSRLQDPERQFWMPVPAGATQAKFRPGKAITWWPSRTDWMARDFSVWSQSGGVITVPAPLPAPVASISVALGASSIVSGQTTTATATLYDAAKAALSGRLVTWTSSNPAVATISSTGAITSLSAGTAVISAVSGSATGQATLTVTAPAPVPAPAPAPVASITVALGANALVVGQSTNAVATLFDALKAILTGRTISWVSSNPAVATISSTGAITTLSAGTATFTATSGSASGQASLTVTAPVAAPVPTPVASVAVALAASSLNVGQSTTASATLRDASYAVLTGRTVTWTSSNPAVATISSAGAISALSAGTAIFTATSGGISGQATLTVRALVAPAPAPVASISVALAASSLNIGQKTTATATMRDAAGAVVTGRSITWTSSNPAVATISSAGTISAISAGTVVLNASNSGVTGQATLTVNPSSTTPVTVGSVNLSLSSLTAAVGQTVTANAVVRDAAGAILTGRTITWSTSNSTVATISSTGVITARAAGTTQISGSTGGKTGYATLTVSASSLVPVANVWLWVQNLTLHVGYSTTAQAYPRDRSNTVLTNRLVTWTSSNPAVATVSSSGVITARAPGNFTITATSEGVSSSVNMTSALIPVVKVGVTVGQNTLNVGQTTTATAYPSDAANGALTGRTIVWSSSDSNVATVSATGVITAKGPGTVTVTATCEGITGTIRVTVK